MWTDSVRLVSGPRGSDVDGFRDTPGLMWTDTLFLMAICPQIWTDSVFDTQAILPRKAVMWTDSVPDLSDLPVFFQNVDGYLVFDGTLPSKVDRFLVDSLDPAKNSSNVDR